MSRPSVPYRPVDAAFDVLVLAAVAAGCAFTTYMLATSWPAGSWRLDLVVSVVMAVCAVVRRVHLVVATVAGLAVAAVATLVAVVAELPQEPGPTAGFALAVVVGSCVRRGDHVLVAGSLLGSVVVLVLSWAGARHQESGFTTVTMALATCLVVGAAAGAVSRMGDVRRRSGAGEEPEWDLR